MKLIRLLISNKNNKNKNILIIRYLFLLDIINGTYESVERVKEMT